MGLRRSINYCTNIKIVIPAKAGIQVLLILDSRPSCVRIYGLRGNDIIFLC